MARLRKSVSDDDSVWAAALAAELAQEIGLPAGNLWEPPMARNLEKRAREVGRQCAEDGARLRLGLY